MGQKMKIPKLCHRKDRDLAFIYDGEKKVYFGKWGAPETIQRYADYVDALINGVDSIVGEARRVVTIADLAARFLEDKKNYYVNVYGEQTGQLQRLQTALQYPLRMFADIPVDEFGPLKLQLVRQQMLDSGRFAREYINTLVNCIRHVFKYGVEQELVKPETLLALKSLSPLKRGRTAARETAPIIPVSADVVNATLTCLAPTLAAMVKLQRLTGMRPCEVCVMRAGDIEQSDNPWTYTLSHDKTDYRRAANDLRTIPLGERAQEVVKPFLNRDSEQFLFTPREAQQQRSAEMRENRQSPITSQTRRRDERTERRQYNPRYTVDSYGRAIKRACQQAGVQPWAPNQLRHLYATEVRAKYGLEAAQIMLGHANADVTQIYAERDRERARQIAKEIG